MERDKTVRELCTELKESDFSDGIQDLADRILSAHEREMAAKDEMNRIIIHSAQARFDEELAAKDAEIAQLTDERNKLAVNTFIKNCTAHNCSAWERIALLERALKPVLECKTWSKFNQIPCYCDTMDAVRDAQRIYKGEGETR